ARLDPLADVLGGVEVSRNVDADASSPAPPNLADHPGREPLFLAGREVAPVGAAKEMEPAAKRVTLFPARRGSPWTGSDRGEGEREDAFPQLRVALLQQVA